jgi:zinc protease
MLTRSHVHRTFAVAAFLAWGAVWPAAGAEIDIPFKKFTLDNGLTLIVHEDHKSPIVAVNVWYHVGSKHEKAGKTGFAHLFEHLMFNGSEHFDDDYFQALERYGATDLNGTTNEDRTNYFQNVPTSALDMVLWLESDRMGHLLGAVTQAKLDEQRGVVQNEKRQGENQPYAIAYELSTKSTWPAGHPYSWTVIGSMEDLNAASLEDVHEWFKTYYGAANAVIVVAGDVKADDVRAKVEKHFGGIPAGPPVSRHQAWVARRTGTQRQWVQDRVPQARLYRLWNVPQWGSAEIEHLSLLARVLTSGKTSRLYKRLVYDDQIATSVSAELDRREIGSQFVIEATARPGDDLTKVEKAIQEELDRLFAGGPTEDELARVQTEFRAGFIRGIERIGGFGGKSDILAESEVYGGSPDFYKTTLARMASATISDLHRVAKEWLTDGDYLLEVHPFPTYRTSDAAVDRSKLPTPGSPPQARFPAFERRTLANGLELIVAERRSVPVVDLRLILDAGYAADQFALPGTAALAMNMLDEGTRSRNALQISEELSKLGARLSSGSNLDSSVVSLSALKENLDASLDLFADVVLNPSFPEADFERLRKQQLAGIQREKVTPIPMALRVFPNLLYGKDHAYGNPLTGSGTEESVQKITRESLIRFHQTWFKPGNASLVVVGDVSMNQIAPKLDGIFRSWPTGEVPQKNVATVPHAERPAVYLIDKPGALQSIIFAGHVGPPRANPDEIAIETMNNILGGTFTSRINLNLREEKHWSYGATSLLVGARGQRPFIVVAPVQTDKTKESMAEVAKELNEFLGSRPATGDELLKNQTNQTLQLAGSWETIDAVGDSLSEIVRYGLEDDYFQVYPEKVISLGLDQIAAAARKVIHPDRLIWVVVGDREKVEAGIRELGWGEVRFIDPDGNPVG